MKKTVEVPEGVSARMEGNELAVSGPKGELRRSFRNARVKLRIEGNTIEVESDIERRKVNSLVGTWAAHIRNMIAGVQSGWSVTLKVVYSHFPVKIGVEGDRFVVQNFMGEKKARSAGIPEGVSVKADKDTVTVSGADKELVGQAAANIELCTKVRGYDKRVFSDGIYILGKPVQGAPEGGK